MHCRPLTISVLLPLALAAAAAAPSSRDSVRDFFRDPFHDGTHRAGPAMIAIPALETDIGATPDDPHYSGEELLHHAVLAPYAIGRYEVTNAEFSAFLSEEGNRVSRGVPWLRPEASQIEQTGKGFAPRAGTEQRPVTGITWRAARAYCQWLSRKTGRHYELPTAAQWEAAARAGTRTAWWWGDADDPARHRSFAHVAEGTADVGSYPPNPWGLHDTSGNVWEWTFDCFEADFGAWAPRNDPVMRREDCLLPEIRGGSFREAGRLSRPAFRSSLWWSVRVDSVGFRVARNGERR
jgi:formylglycine-generating enzyme required for sulfatase activity